MKDKKRMKRVAALLLCMAILVTSSSGTSMVKATDIVEEEQSTVIQETPPVVEETESEKPPIVEEVEPEKPPVVEEAEPEKPPVVEEKPEQEETEKPPVVEEEIKLEPGKKSDALPIQSKADTGLLGIGAVGGKFVAGLNKKVDLEVLYKPSVDGKDKKVVFSGFKESGVEIVTPATVGQEITKVELSSDKNTMTVFFADTMTTATNISFRFQVKISDEVTFVDALSLDTNHLTKLSLKESVGGIAYKAASSDIEISYTWVEGTDIRTKPGNPSSDRLSDKVGGTTVLCVSAQDVDSLDGSGWRNKEAKYRLSGGPAGYLYARFSERYIKRLKIEIPLPNNVTYISSEYAGGKDGITISYDSGRNYIILECNSLRQVVGNELVFTMTLNFQGLNGVVTEEASQYGGVDKWHDFYSNNSGVPGRNEAYRPWKFSGEMFGVKQEVTFNQRSMIMLDSLSYNKPPGFRATIYEYSKKQTNVPISARTIGEDPSGVFDRHVEKGVQYGTGGYTRQVIYDMDETIHTTSVEFSGSKLTDLEKTLNVSFQSNKGRTIEKGIGDVDPTTLKMMAPPCEAGEYFKKIIVSFTSENKDPYGFRLMVDIMDTRLDGTPLQPFKTSYVNRSYDIKEYGRIPTSSDNITSSPRARCRYIEGKATTPKVEFKSIGGHIDPNLPVVSRFFWGEEYSNVNLITISNNGLETSQDKLEDLLDVRTGTRNVSSKDVPKTISYPLYQLAGEKSATITLRNYGDKAALPDVTLHPVTGKGSGKDITVPKTAFVKTGEQEYQAPVDWQVAANDYLKEFDITVSSLPVMAEVSVTADSLNLTENILPDGTDIRNYGKLNGGHGQSWQNLETTIDYMRLSGNKETKKTNYGYVGELYGKMGMLFSGIFINEARTPERPKALEQGKAVDLQFELRDVAFNPVYAFEVDQRFNYMKGSFQHIADQGNENLKFVEEWIPGYFQNTGDSARDGNGLLRIRFVGGKGTAYNLFPVTNSSERGNGAPYRFEMRFQAKTEAVPGTYHMIQNVYRSDEWAKEELKGKFVEVINHEGFMGTGGRNPVEIMGEYVTPEIGSIITDVDRFDIDGDGKTNTTIAVRDMSTVGSEKFKQQITKIAKTKVDGYLIDPESGNELRDAKLYPHQEFDFVQLMEVVDDVNYSEFVGYYHIPKKDHKIVYADRESGTQKTYVSEFDTYLETFISTSVEGVDVSDTGKIEVYYYVSDDPTDLTDGHNTMNELEDDDSVDDMSHYKTKAEIQAMVTADRTLQDILADVTMVKIKAPILEARKTIKCTARMSMGHKEKGAGELLDYFSGVYRYKTGSGIRLNTQYTPLMTFTMMDYVVQGTLWHDKNADSKMDPVEEKLKNITVELWETGHDAHTGAVIADKKVAETVTKADGTYQFTRSYHGEYFLKFRIPEEQKLSLSGVYGVLPYEASVFQTDGVNGKAAFELTDKSFLYQNAGLVDQRTLEVPKEIYISVNESRIPSHIITPEYLMYDPEYQIIPTVESDAANDSIFTTDPATGNLTGVAPGSGKIKVSIPDAPLDGSTRITKEMTVHVEPETVASVSVPTKAEVYAQRGKENQLIAPNLTIHNYDPSPVKASIRAMDFQNTGTGKHLKLVGKKATGEVYNADEISLSIVPVEQKNNPFAKLSPTDVTKIESSGGLPLGTMDAFMQELNWGSFTFAGAYNANIRETELADNRFALYYRFERVAKP